MLNIELVKYCFCLRRYFDQRLSWIEAEEVCQKHFGHLVRGKNCWISPVLSYPYQPSYPFGPVFGYLGNTAKLSVTILVHPAVTNQNTQVEGQKC